MNVSDIDFNKLNGPQRQVLRQALMGVFGSRSALDMFLEESGYGALEDLVGAGPFKRQTFELVRELARTGQLAGLVADVRAKLPEAPALEDLETRLGFVDAQASKQLVAGGQNLEALVRDAGFQDLNLWADRLSEAGRRVCRIAYRTDHGMPDGGTGFLVASDLVLTNYHVIENVHKGRAKADRVQLSFGYAETAGGLSAGDAHRLAEDWLVAHAPYSKTDLTENSGLPEESELDFALLRLDQPAGDAEGRAGKRGWFDLASAPEPVRDDAVVFVLQHPDGKPLKQSIGILKDSATPLRLRYDADTAGGSSGGLVLDQRLAPVALHHVGGPLSDNKATYNQGVPLTLIHAALPSGFTAPHARRASGTSASATEPKPGSAVKGTENAAPERLPPDPVKRADSGRPPLLFYSYAYEDEDFRRQLALHLKLLEREKILRTWYDGDIMPGAEREREIQQRLQEADIILLLASVNYLASDELWSREVEIALDRHDKREARVIPIILRSVVWDNTPLHQLQPLPHDRRAIADLSKSGRDQAFAEIAGAIREIAAKITKDRS